MTSAFQQACHCHCVNAITCYLATPHHHAVLTPTSFFSFLPQLLLQLRASRFLSWVAWRLSKLASPWPLECDHIFPLKVILDPFISFQGDMGRFPLKGGVKSHQVPPTFPLSQINCHRKSRPLAVASLRLLLRTPFQRVQQRPKVPGSLILSTGC